MSAIKPIDQIIIRVVPWILWVNNLRVLQPVDRMMVWVENKYSPAVARVILIGLAAAVGLPVGMLIRAIIGLPPW